MSPKKERKDPAYIREQGNKEAKGNKQRKITFSLSKHIPNVGGQTIEDWDSSGLMVLLFNRLKFVGQFSAIEVRQNQYIKEYTKVDFPPNSKFKKPNHITNVTWAVMHITGTSKEVVVGYIEDDVFYIVFLDKDHDFWVCSK